MLFRSLVFVELPKFKPKTIAEKKMAVLWFRFLTEIGERTVDVPTELLDNKLTSKALGIIEKAAMSDEQLNAYEHFWLAVHDEEAIHYGHYIKGHEDGLQQGRTEEKIAIAKSLKQMGLPVDQISSATGLTLSEIDAL